MAPSTRKPAKPNGVLPKTDATKKRKADTEDAPPPAAKKANIGRKRKSDADLRTAVPTKKTTKTASDAKAAPKATPAAAAATVKKSTKASAPATSKKPTKATSNTTKKPAVKAKKEEVKTETSATASKKRKADVGATASKEVKKPKTSINSAPKDPLDVYVFGEGGNNELGLGTVKSLKVMRPRLNQLLNAEKVGVVQIAAGAMHALALTKYNKILTWGVNDEGALGRPTDDKSKKVDIEGGEDSDSDDEDTGLNPEESTPTRIPDSAFPEGVNISQVAAGDSISLALTDTGDVYAWGVFRSNEGKLGFRPAEKGQSAKSQLSPMLVPELKNITSIVCGNNHVLALDKAGKVWAWGSGQQYQLGRKMVERNMNHNLKPVPVPLPPRKKFRSIAAGAYHSFAIEQDGSVWAWGLNFDGQCGDADFDETDEDGGHITRPTKMENLSKFDFKELDGGDHHTVGIAANGDAIVWGKAEGGRLGLKLSDLPESSVVKKNGEVVIVKEPTVLATVGPVHQVAAESGHTYFITKKGQAWTCGFNENYQAAQGPNLDIVTEATLVDNTATRGKKLCGAGAGAQYGIFVGVHGELIKGMEDVAA